MTTYARLTPDKLALEQTVELTTEELAALGEWKQSFMRLYVIDAQPTPSATQKVIDGAPLIDETSYHRTWALIDKSAAELEAEAISTEKAELEDRITKLKAAIDQYQALLDVPYAEPAQAGSNALEITALRDRMRDQERAMRDVYRDLILAMKSARWLCRDALSTL